MEYLSQEFQLVSSQVHAEAAFHKCSYNISVLNICSKFTREHPCRSVILIKLLCNNFFIRTPFEGCFCACQVQDISQYLSDLFLNLKQHEQFKIYFKKGMILFILYKFQKPIKGQCFYYIETSQLFWRANHLT